VAGFAVASCVLQASKLPSCGDETVPRGILRRITKAESLIEQAQGFPSNSRPAGRLLRRALRKLKLALKFTVRLSNEHRMSRDCAAAFERLLGDAQGRLGTLLQP